MLAMISNSIALLIYPSTMSLNKGVATRSTCTTKRNKVGRSTTIIPTGATVCSSSDECNVVDRRRFFSYALITGAASLISHPFEAQGVDATISGSSSTSLIGSRLSADRLVLPPLSSSGRVGANELISNSIDNVYYPQWLSGTWDATQTLVQTSTPLGLKYIGGPNGSESIALQSLNEQNKQLNVPVSFKLHYVDTKLGGVKLNVGVAEDRSFNTKQRLNAFAGRNVVASVEYADVSGSNRSSVLAMGGNSDTPLQTTSKFLHLTHDTVYFISKVYL